MTPTVRQLQPKTIHVMTRKRTFEAVSNDDLMNIIDDLMSARHTGPIHIQMSQGGIRTVSVEDHATVAS